MLSEHAVRGGKRRPHFNYKTCKKIKTPTRIEMWIMFCYNLLDFGCFLLAPPAGRGCQQEGGWHWGSTTGLIEIASAISDDTACLGHSTHTVFGFK